MGHCNIARIQDVFASLVEPAERTSLIGLYLQSRSSSTKPLRPSPQIAFCIKQFKTISTPIEIGSIEIGVLPWLSDRCFDGNAASRRSLSLRSTSLSVDKAG